MVALSPFMMMRNVFHSPTGLSREPADRDQRLLAVVHTGRRYKSASFLVSPLGVPDLHLWLVMKIDAAVALGQDLPIDPKAPKLP